MRCERGRRKSREAERKYKVQGTGGIELITVVSFSCHNGDRESAERPHKPTYAEFSLTGFFDCLSHAILCNSIGLL